MDARTLRTLDCRSTREICPWLAVISAMMIGRLTLREGRTRLAP
jgi:hypothetical protein